MADRFLISPLNSGLQNNVRPFLIADDAYAQLSNAYLFRGRVRKRFGSYLMNGSVDPEVAQLYSRLRIKIGTTDGSGNIAPGTVPGSIFVVGQLFSIGDGIFTVNVTGTPAALKTTGPGTGTYDTTSGAYTFTGAAPSTDVYFYPALPVVGITNYETNDVNDEPTYAFDTQFAYQYISADGGGWDRLGTAVWTGDNADFFWATTWIGSTDSSNILYVTNYNFSATLTGSDPIRYWDGANWANFQPVFTSGTATNTILTSRIIVVFKDRLLLLNVVENTGMSPGTNTVYVNRCRFSQNGSPLASDAWYENIPGKGGRLDAPTKEAIITAEFLKDRLIVFFERSTWELAYTGNQILPFVWQKLNTELGVESTFSVVPFDKVLLGIGNVGIHACNGVNVDRIDELIPTEVFEIHNDNEGVFRVNGIRDYFVEMVYWSFPSGASPIQYDQVYPNRVLVYNYITKSWAFNDDTITFFGYFQNISGTTWGSTESTWEESVEEWSSGTITSKFRQVLAGNQQGFMFIVDSDETRNSPSLQITDIPAITSPLVLTVYDHNMMDDDYIIIESVQGMTGLSDNIYQIKVIDADTFSILTGPISGAYTGGGTIARISKIDILSKQYNFYQQQGKNVSVSQVNFYVDKTVNGQVRVDYFSSSSDVSSIVNGLPSGAITGTSVLETSPYDLYPLEEFQDRLWHPVYMWSEGECIQVRIYLDDNQMLVPDIVFSDFELNAMLFICNPTSSRFQ